ncbi:MAG: hypothetical protein ABIP21_11255 [Acidimicrobiia bacterium]
MRALWDRTRDSGAQGRYESTAADASALLASTTALDADVVEGLTRLVDTLVTRQF